MIPFAANALQCIVNGEETPKTVPFPLRFCNHAGGQLSHGHIRQYAYRYLAIGLWLRLCSYGANTPMC